MSSDTRYIARDTPRVTLTAEKRLFYSKMTFGASAPDHLEMLFSTKSLDYV